MNSVNILGALMSEPNQIFVGAKQTPYSSFFLAVSRGRKNQEGKIVTDYLQVRAFGPQSNYIKNYCKKLDLIFVQGRMQSDKYITKTGRQVYITYVLAEKVGAAGYSRSKIYRLYGFDVRQAEKEAAAARAAAAAAEKEAAAGNVQPEDNGSDADLGALDW